MGNRLPGLVAKQQESKTGSATTEAVASRHSLGGAIDATGTWRPSVHEFDAIRDSESGDPSDPMTEDPTETTVDSTPVDQYPDTNRESDGVVRATSSLSTPSTPSVPSSPRGGSELSRTVVSSPLHSSSSGSTLARKDKDIDTGIVQEEQIATLPTSPHAEPTSSSSTGGSTMTIASYDSHKVGTKWHIKDVRGWSFGVEKQGKEMRLMAYSSSGDVSMLPTLRSECAFRTCPVCDGVEFAEGDGNEIVELDGCHHVFGLHCCRPYVSTRGQCPVVACGRRVAWPTGLIRWAPFSNTCPSCKSSSLVFDTDTRFAMMSMAECTSSSCRDSFVFLRNSVDARRRLLYETRVECAALGCRWSGTGGLHGTWFVNHCHSNIIWSDSMALSMAFDPPPAPPAYLGYASAATSSSVSALSCSSSVSFSSVSTSVSSPSSSSASDSASAASTPSSHGASSSPSSSSSSSMSYISPIEPLSSMSSPLPASPSTCLTTVSSSVTESSSRSSAASTLLPTETSVSYSSFVDVGLDGRRVWDGSLSSTTLSVSIPELPTPPTVVRRSDPEYDAKRQWASAAQSMSPMPHCTRSTFVCCFCLRHMTWARLVAHWSESCPLALFPCRKCCAMTRVAHMNVHTCPSAPSRLCTSKEVETKGEESRETEWKEASKVICPFVILGSACLRPMTTREYSEHGLSGLEILGHQRALFKHVMRPPTVAWMSLVDAWSPDSEQVNCRVVTHERPSEFEDDEDEREYINRQAWQQSAMSQELDRQQESKKTHTGVWGYVAYGAYDSTTPLSFLDHGIPAGRVPEVFPILRRAVFRRPPATGTLTSVGSSDCVAIATFVDGGHPLTQPMTRDLWNTRVWRDWVAS